MIKSFKQMCSAILLCVAAVGFISSCQKETPRVVNPADVELSNYDWDVVFPYEVYMAAGAAAELKDAYSDFITVGASAITDNTYMVILDKVSDLPEEQFVELYEKGVVMAILHPKKAEIQAVFERNPEMGYFLDDDSIDSALLLAISGWNNGYYIIPSTEEYLERYSFESDHTVVPDPMDAEAGEYDANEAPIYTDKETLENDLTYYFFGTFLEDLLRQQAIYDAEVAQSKADGEDKDKGIASIKKITGRVHVSAYGVFSINEVFFRTSYRFNGTAPVTVAFDVYPIHVYEGENGAGDYYFMDMTANVANEKMFQGKRAEWTSFFWVYLRWCGAYITSFKVRNTLIDKNGQAVADFPSEGFPIPETVNKTTNYSKTKTFNIGCGVSANLGGEKGKDVDGQNETTSSGINGGGTVNVNAGWSWSDTKSWTEKDVDVSNNSANNTAAWGLKFNNVPKFAFSEDQGFDLGNSDTYRSSMQIRGSWVWYMSDKPDDTESDPLRVKVEAEGNYGFMKFWGTKADMNTYDWHCSFTDIKPMPKIINYRAGNLILKNNFAGKYISNIMVYNSKGQALIPKSTFQNSYPAGTDIKLGAYACKDDLMVKFKMDGKTYKYSLNPYVKTVFKDDVILYADNDFSVE